MKKRMIALTMVLALTAAALAGCGGGGKTEKNTAVAGETTGEQAAQSPAVVEVKLAFETTTEEPMGKACVRWAELLKEKSGGTMEMKLYPSSQLGSKNDLMDQMLAGSNIITLGDGGYLSERGAPDMSIVVSPYLFDNWDQCWKLMESDWWQEQCDILADNGLKILTSNWMYGTRHYLTKSPVKTVEDMKGMKIRTADSTVWIAATKVLGATPTPMAFSETYTALQQGVADGTESPAPQLHDASFDEVCKNLVLDGHVKNITMWFTSSTWFDTLTDEQKQWVIDSGNEAGLYSQELTSAAEDEAVKTMESEQGVTVIELDEAALQGFKTAAEPFYDMPEVNSKWSDGLLEKVQAIIR